MSDRVVKFETQIHGEQHGKVGIWWFPRNFSQSTFADRSSGSNACTLIALLFAHRCYEQNIKISSSLQERQDKLLTNALANSIMEGNEIHDKLRKKGALANVNMTIPEAIEAARTKLRFIKEWKSLVFMMDLGETLYEQLKESLDKWYRDPPKRCGSDLYVILIADSRSVLLIFEQDMVKVTLVDSHQHRRHGALVAQVASENLDMLCRWFQQMIQECYDSQPVCYELSFLYFKQFEAVEKPTKLV